MTGRPWASVAQRELIPLRGADRHPRVVAVVLARLTLREEPLASSEQRARVLCRRLGLSPLRAGRAAAQVLLAVSAVDYWAPRGFSEPLHDRLEAALDALYEDAR